MNARAIYPCDDGGKCLDSGAGDTVSLDGQSAQFETYDGAATHVLARRRAWSLALVASWFRGDEQAPNVAEVVTDKTIAAINAR